MTLTQEINTLRQQIQAKMSEETKAVMDKAMEDLVNSRVADRRLKFGDKAPNFALPNAVGKTVELQDLLSRNPVVISFYRGGWCPYCNLELRSLQQSLAEMKKLGATLVAISPQTPDNSLSTVEKNELEFEVLSDAGNQVAKDFGLVFVLPEELRPIYQDFGIDLPAHNGDNTFELPIPATYVIAQNGTIIHAFVDPDYTKRLDPAEIIAALKQRSVAA